MSNSEAFLALFAICLFFVGLWVGIVAGNQNGVPYPTLYKNNITVDHDGYKRFIVRQKSSDFSEKLSQELGVAIEKK